VPAPLLKIIVGEGEETITKTPFVKSEVLDNSNYKFKFESSYQALKNILQKT
jgi:NAD dependent epimerase/dehydratase family enzyme